MAHAKFVVFKRSIKLIIKQPTGLIFGILHRVVSQVLRCPKYVYEVFHFLALVYVMTR
jgi:hypothetical protein